MDERQIIFNITLIIFSISFSWMVNGRITKYPKIRRFYNLKYLFNRKKENKRLKTNMIVLFCSWPVIFISLWFSIYGLVKYYEAFNSSSIFHQIIYWYFIPILFFISPQFISRLISSLVFWLAKDEIRYLWKNDREQFNVFSDEWKMEYGLTPIGIKKGTIHETCKGRALSSLITLIAIYFLIFLFTIF